MPILHVWVSLVPSHAASSSQPLPTHLRLLPECTPPPGLAPRGLCPGFRGGVSLKCETHDAQCFTRGYVSLLSCAASRGSSPFEPFSVPVHPAGVQQHLCPGCSR